MVGGNGESETETMVLQETGTYSSQKERQGRLDRIEKLKGIVLPERRTNGRIGHTVMSKIQKSANDIKYVGYDVDNMPWWRKVAVDVGTRVGVTSPWKRVNGERQVVERFIDGLEDIVDDCKTDLNHPSKGYYAGLNDIETLQDEAIELRELSIAEMTDLALEIKELNKQYQDKISGNGSVDKTVAKIMEEVRARQSTYETFDEMKEEANIRIEEAYNEREGLVMDIGDTKAVITETKELIYEAKRTLIDYSSDSRLAEYVHAVSELVQGNVTPLEKYREHMGQLRAYRGELTEGIGNLQKISIGASASAVPEIDRSHIIEQSMKKAEARDERVMQIIEARKEAPFLV